MRIFEKPNLHAGWKCPVCGTSEETPVILVGISGTEREHIIEARQYHVDCIELREYVSGNEVMVGFVYDKEIEK